MYEYGADGVALMPLGPKDVSDKLLLLISIGKIVGRQNGLV